MMYNNSKYWLIIATLLFSIVYCFGFPKAKYVSQNILSQLNIPQEIGTWHGKDIEQEWNMELEDERYNFIGKSFNREYTNTNDDKLFLMVLDAGNFHNPRVCAYSAGFKVRELNDLEFHIQNHLLRAHVLYTSKDKEGFLIIYWICIDKFIVDWTEQKIKQLWFSLVNKKRVGLMIRFDIPTREDNLDNALKLAKEFISDLSNYLPTNDADYIFGSNHKPTIVQ